MSEWVTHEQAAGLLGVGKTTVQRLADDGILVRRDTTARGRPSLSRQSVLVHLEALEEARDLRKAREAERAARRVVSPDLPGEWLREKPAAIVAGMSGPGLGKRAKRGGIPHVAINGYRWYRRDQMEMFASSRRAPEPEHPEEYRSRGLASPFRPEEPTEKHPADGGVGPHRPLRPDGMPWTLAELAAARHRLRSSPSPLSQRETR